MTVSENEDVSPKREEGCISERSNSTLGARRKGTCGNVTVQITQTKHDMEFPGCADVECESEHSYWVESWLDEHPDFFQAYLIRKGTRSMIDSWLVTHALPPGITATTLNNVDEEELEDADNNRLCSKSGTPIRESDFVIGSPNPNITVHNENSVGTSGASIPSGPGNKVPLIIHDKICIK
jgi:hypothetical protein